MEIVLLNHKFLHPRHREAQQTNGSEFGAEEGFLQGQSRRMGGSWSKPPNSQVVFGEVFMDKIWGEETVSWLLLLCFYIYSLPWLAAVLNLPLGTQARSRRMNEAHFLYIRNGGGVGDKYFNLTSLRQNQNNVCWWVRNKEYHNAL